VREEEEKAEEKAVRGRTPGLAGVAVLAAVALWAPAAHGTVIPVTATADNIDDDQLCTLREAISAAASNIPFNPTGGNDCPAGDAGSLDTVDLAAANYVMDDGGFGDFNVTATPASGPVELVGDGSSQTTVFGAEDRVFQFAGSGSAALRDMRVTQGELISESGAGVASAVANLTLDGLLVDGNSISATASAGGGGVDISSGTATLTDTVIAANAIEGSAGAAGLVNGGGLRVGSTAVVTVSRSEISDNTVSGGSVKTVRGAGIATVDSTQDLSISNTLIEGNQSTGTLATEGGGIFWDDDGADNDLRIQNATFSGNAADSGGGAQFQNGDVTLAFVTFGPNTAASGNGIRNDALAADLEMRGTALDSGGEDCFGADPVSLGGNVEREADDCGFNQTSDVIATDPVFFALADNGGPTRTHSLEFDFRNTVPPAICLGSDGSALTRDQRNAFRPGAGASPNPNCDAGAHESNFCNTETVTLVGTEGDDTIAGTSGEDGILGMGGADTINPGAQDDDACGGDGNDVFQAHTSDSQNDLYFGDAGSDTVTLASFLDPSTIDLAAGTLTGAGLGAETLTSIENATGGLDPDTITGDAGPNVLDGFLDGDTITGGAGFDTLIGNTGDDDIFARDGGPDTVDCGLGSADTAQTDQPSLDTTVGCETIDALPEPPPANPATPTAKKKKCKKGRKLKKVKGKFKCVKKKRRKRK
jgi:CSLREA domain-containing protein